MQMWHAAGSIGSKEALDEEANKKMRHKDVCVESPFHVKHAVLSSSSAAMCLSESNARTLYGPRPGQEARKLEAR